MSMESYRSVLHETDLNNPRQSLYVYIYIYTILLNQDSDIEDMK